LSFLLLSTDCAKNYCNQKLAVEVIVENVPIVTCFSKTRCIFDNTVTCKKACSYCTGWLLCLDDNGVVRNSRKQ